DGALSAAVSARLVPFATQDFDQGSDGIRIVIHDQHPQPRAERCQHRFVLFRGEHGSNVAAGHYREALVLPKLWLPCALRNKVAVSHAQVGREWHRPKAAARRAGLPLSNPKGVTELISRGGGDSITG